MRGRMPSVTGADCAAVTAAPPYTGELSTRATYCVGVLTAPEGTTVKLPLLPHLALPTSAPAASTTCTAPVCRQSDTGTPASSRTATLKLAYTDGPSPAYTPGLTATTLRPVSRVSWIWAADAVAGAARAAVAAARR